MNSVYKLERINLEDEELEKRLEDIMEKKIHSAISKMDHWIYEML